MFALILAGFLPASARADDPLIRQFATCAGRYSAQMEHQWLLGSVQSSDTGVLRGMFADLLEAVVTDATARRALSLRIDAKHAHAVLLQRASFGRRDAQADWAANRAAAALAACSDLVALPVPAVAAQPGVDPASASSTTVKIRN